MLISPDQLNSELAKLRAMRSAGNSTALKPRFQKTHHMLMGCFDCFVRDPTIVNSDGLKVAMVHYERIFLEARNKGIKVTIDDK